MNVMKNASMKVKVMLPISTLAVLLLVSALVNIRNLGAMRDVGQEVSEHYAESISLLGAIARDFQSLHRVVYEHCLSDDKEEMERLAVEASSLREQIQTDHIACGEVLKGEEAEALEVFEEKYQEYLSVFTEAIRLSDAGRTKQVQELAQGRLSSIGVEISEVIEELIQKNQEGMEKAQQRQVTTYKLSVLLLVIILVFTALVDVCAIIISRLYISKPLGRIKMKLDKIIKDLQSGHGDLTERVSVDSRDELGQIAMGINVFLETLQGIMSQITSSSVKLEDVVGTVVNHVAEANDNAADISAVMQELAASMEEISSTIADISENVSGVDGDVTELARASADLFDYAGQMRSRAEDLENTAVSTKENTSTVVSNIIERLEAAIAESKSVEKVNDLTEEILSISSQTNLLALNASIEAARAGEAGKGFAVVADEISNLADESREAANNIQNINKMVVQAVNDLIEQAKAVVSYINENIFKDYDGFVASGAKYRDDAVYVNEVVSRFNQMVEELQRLMGSITQSVQGIASAVDESANGVTSAAMNTTDLVQGIGKVASQMDDNKSIANQLGEEASRFDRV